MSPPRPLYVSRRVRNARSIIAWAKRQGFKSTLAPGDMHVTVCYSSAPMDWNAVPDSFDRIQVGDGGRSIKRLGDKGAVVLTLRSPDLQRRWQEFRDAGASWDYESYTPHITLTYDGGPDDVESIAPYRGTIKLGPERFEALDEDWADEITEAPLVKAQPAASDDSQPAAPDAAPSPNQDHAPHIPAYLDAIRAKLADLAVMRHQTAGAHLAIVQAAGHRLEAVQRELADLAPRTILDDDAAEQYRALIVERGRLHRLTAAEPHA